VKKVTILLVIVGMLLLTACSNKEFTAKLESGKEALNAQNFEAALTDLSKANELDPQDKEAKALLEITQNIVDSQAAMNNGEFEAAIFLIDKVLNQKVNEGNKQAVSFAKQTKQELQSLNEQTAGLKEAMATSKSLIEEKKFDEAIAVLKKADMTESKMDSITKLQNDVKLLQLEAEKDKEIAVAQQKLEEEKKAAKRKAEEAKKRINSAQTAADAVNLVESLDPGNYSAQHMSEYDLITEDTSFYYYIAYAAASGLGGDVFVQKGTGKIYGTMMGTETDPNAPFPDFSNEIR